MRSVLCKARTERIVQHSIDVRFGHGVCVRLYACIFVYISLEFCLEFDTVYSVQLFVVFVAAAVAATTAPVNNDDDDSNIAIATASNVGIIQPVSHTEILTMNVAQV